MRTQGRPAQPQACFQPFALWPDLCAALVAGGALRPLALPLPRVPPSAWSLRSIPFTAPRAVCRPVPFLSEPPEVVTQGEVQGTRPRAQRLSPRPRCGPLRRRLQLPPARGPPRRRQPSSPSSGCGRYPPHHASRASGLSGFVFRPPGVGRQRSSSGVQRAELAPRGPCPSRDCSPVTAGGRVVLPPHPSPWLLPALSRPDLGTDHPPPPPRPRLTLPSALDPAF